MDRPPAVKAVVVSVAAAVGVGVLAYLRWVRRKNVLMGFDVAARFRGCGGLRNTFFLVRHGQSEANVAGIISSDPAVGTVRHSITARGEQQAKRAGERIAALCAEAGVGRAQLGEKVKIFCSDFLRTRKTAAAVAAELGIEARKITPQLRLRERYFGSLDGTSDANYNEVWKFDKDSVLHEEYGCESVASVVRRAGNLVLDLDRQFEGSVIVLVAHGDVLQILRSAFEGQFPPALHRFGEGLQTGSVTQLRVTGYCDA